MDEEDRDGQGDGRGNTIRRPRWRARLVRLVFVGVVVLQVGLLVRGGHDVHKRFGFRPFNESDTWQVDLAREIDGELVPIDRGRWEGYEWNDLVGTARLRTVWRERHASSGAAASIDYLDRALDWVAEHTPDDRTTERLVAEVTWYHNGRGPFTTVVTSEPRDLGP